MKICAIFTGGTIGSTVDENGYISADEEKKYLLLDLYQKRYNNKHEFVVRSPYYILSENLDGKHINLLIQEIEVDLAAGVYDCILVMHGTDTLCYSAAALSLLFDGCDIPVILVSADHPISDERSNGPDNLDGAVRFAEYAAQKGGAYAKGVFVSYRNSDGIIKIHRGQYVLEQQFMSADVNSVGGMHYGYFKPGSSTDTGCGAFVQNINYRDTFLCHAISELRERIRKTAPEQFEGFYVPERCPVLRLFAYPGISYPENLSGIKSVLIKGYHSGTIGDSDELRVFTSQCRMRGITVYVAGLPEDENVYESTRIYDELGIKVLFNMTDITAFMFLWFSAEID